MPRSVWSKLPGRSSAILLILLVLISGISGCGISETSSAAPAAGNNVHGSGWKFSHGDAASADLAGCQVCHGGDFKGNGNAVACYSCHIGGPPFMIHPASFQPGLAWKHPVNHGSQAKRDLQACQGCHGQPGGPGSNPRFNVKIGSLEAGCESTAGCHSNFNDPFASFENGHNLGTAHPSFDPNDPAKQDLFHWYGERLEYLDGSGQTQSYLVSHFNAGNISGACSLCHGANLQGGAGPACSACHVLNPITFPSNCLSCHGAPPIAVDDFITEVGRIEPLDPLYLAEVRAGLHLQHEAIPCAKRQTQDDCRLCHVNTETGLSGMDLRTNVNRHHLLVFTPIPDPPPPGVNGFINAGRTYECLSCHVNLDSNTGAFNEPFRDCSACHPALFPSGPCPE